jgi:hypothetical protein
MDSLPTPGKEAQPLLSELSSQNTKGQNPGHSQLRRAGHVARMTKDRISKRIFYGELKSGARTKGGQKKRYKDTLGHHEMLYNNLNYN